MFKNCTRRHFKSELDISLRARYDVILYQSASAVCYHYVCAIHKQTGKRGGDLNPVYSPTGIILVVKRPIDLNAIIVAAHRTVAKTDLKTEQENV